MKCDGIRALVHRHGALLPALALILAVSLSLATAIPVPAASAAGVAPAAVAGGGALRALARRLMQWPTGPP